MAIVTTDTKYYRAIADKVRELKGTNEMFYPSEMPQGIQEVYEKGKAEGGDTEQAYKDGKKAQYDEFWENYQNGGLRDHYTYAFSWLGWNDTCYNPKYPIIGGATKFGLQQVFIQNTQITDTKVDLIDRKGSIKQICHNCASLQKIPLLQLEAPVTDNTDKAAENAFYKCEKLTDITIKCVGDGCIATSISFSYSSKLTAESILSIFRALKRYATTDTGYLANTLTLNANAWTTINTAYPNGTEDMPLADGEIWQDYAFSIGWGT